MSETVSYQVIDEKSGEMSRNNSRKNVLSGEEDIVIAKMDATANDVPSPYSVRGFPTLYFAPKNSKKSPKSYEGGREVNDFIKYLAREATDELSGYSRDGKKKKSKKTEL